MKPLNTNSNTTNVKVKGPNAKKRTSNTAKTAKNKYKSVKKAVPLKAKEIHQKLDRVATTASKQLSKQTSTALVQAIPASMKPVSHKDETDHLLDISLTSLHVQTPVKKRVTSNQVVRSSPRRPKPIRRFEHEIQKLATAQNGHKSASESTTEVKKIEKVNTKIKRMKSAMLNGRSKLVNEESMIDDEDIVDGHVNVTNGLNGDPGKVIKCDPFDKPTGTIDVGVDALEYQNGRDNISSNVHNGNILKKTFSKILNKIPSNSSLNGHEVTDEKTDNVQRQNDSNGVVEDDSAPRSTCSIS